MNLMTRRSFITALLATAAVSAGLFTQQARADKKRRRRGRRDRERERPDHDTAWSARVDGSILALPEVLALVRPQIDGEIIEIKFDTEHGGPVYEFKYVDRGGRVRELYADARTGVILKDKPE
jgi:uncharacterized membrane protein YkoI